MQVELPAPVTVIHTGRPGHPHKVVNLAYLQEAMSPHWAILIAKLMKALKIHPHTQEHEMKRYGVERKFVNSWLPVLSWFASPTQASYFLCETSGLCWMSAPIVQKYQTAQVFCIRPNSLWHLDGHHKLIMWGIVIHGVIDGYCHIVCEPCIVQINVFFDILWVGHCTLG
jgi:hypothetical protein